MGEPNNALAVYMNRPERIRDLLEYYLGAGLPEDWECEEMRGFYTVRNSKGKLSFRQRDYLGKARLKGVSFLLGLENQDSVNLTYPWRLMELDYLAYGREVEEVQERNELAEEAYGQEDDFKYRYKKEDRILPVLNLTLYWGKGKWREPLSLRDMMADMADLPGKLQNLAGDYRVHLIPMRSIPEEDLRKMGSDLKYVLGIMKHTGAKRRYERYIMENRSFFAGIPKSAVDVIDACTNIRNCLQITAASLWQFLLYFRAFA
ncbi:Rpn family recombination-promoting nuclease/putative transposase [uncultured Acetatifactor sp.]|uniref:Rpn family recombination-promoting nuclease/putative transposase n=1 Tax=uncultured Acetatifactor sp. TaxID=1671927 RepID=UPI0026118B90|nr:Rpn family recombination-promoting nuclease/putative transposase [uncultured Acetatifactor sp.]